MEAAEAPGEGITGYPASWYVATAPIPPARPALQGTVECDVCVIGGGYTGLSAALHLAGRGYSVVLLEACRVGWGASGRNGGQLGTGQRLAEEDLEARFGPGTARRLFTLAQEARALVRDTISTHAIDCDLTPGQIIAAARPAHGRDLRRRAERLARVYGYGQMRYLPAPELRAHVDSPRYHGGCLDEGAAHLHPLKYALGLASAAARAGAELYENTRVTGYTRTAPVTVTTADGAEVRAAHLVLGCNAHLGLLEPRIAGRIMAINSFSVATEPLGPVGHRLIPGAACVHDTFFVLNYFRIAPDGRLLFSGGENYRPRIPADLARLVRAPLARIFPQLGDVAIEHAWGGRLAITMNRLPHLGRLGPNIWYAQGYSGHGIALATLAGQLIAEALAGTAERFDVLARMPPPPFPGGALLRWPALMVGMWWYTLRDRL